ncbi:MAG: LolA-related protein [Rhodanobacteraceae bacterium]
MTTLTLLLASATCPIPSRAAPEAQAGGLDAGALVAGLKRPAPAHTAYAEVRFSGLLDRPLILHGELEYEGPGKLAKTVTAPYRERTTIESGEASVQRGDKAVRKFSLGQAPELEGFLRGFTALLGGDAQALQKDFEVTASGRSDAWRLTLKPRDNRLAKRITAIEVDGTGTSARCFSTHEADGDVNVLLVESLAEAKLPTRPTEPMIDALCRGISR